MPSPCLIVDTFPAFSAWWEEARHLPLSAQIEAWHDRYMAAYPELRRLQVADYTGQGLDWRQVAREQVFPFLEERRPAMAQAHERILRLAPWVCHLARERVGLDFSCLVVLYVGIGCGAGWATRYQGQPACLMGLEMIAQHG